MIRHCEKRSHARDPSSSDCASQEMDGQRQSAGRSRPMMKGRVERKRRSNLANGGRLPLTMASCQDCKPSLSIRRSNQGATCDRPTETILASLCMGLPTPQIPLALVREEEKGKKWLADHSLPIREQKSVSAPLLTSLCTLRLGEVGTSVPSSSAACDQKCDTDDGSPTKSDQTCRSPRCTHALLLSALCNLKPRVSGRCSTPTQTGLAQTGKGGFPVSFCAACALTHTPSIGSKQLFSQSTSSHDRLFRAGVGTCSSTATD